MSTRGVVVRGSEQVSMYEMRKRKQIHENARKMCCAKVLVEKSGKMEKSPFGRSWLGQKNGHAGRSFDMV